MMIKAWFWVKGSSMQHLYPIKPREMRFTGSHSLDVFDLRAIVVVILRVGGGDGGGSWRDAHLHQRDGGGSASKCVSTFAYVM